MRGGRCCRRIDRSKQREFTHAWVLNRGSASFHEAVPANHLEATAVERPHNRIDGRGDAERVVAASQRFVRFRKRSLPSTPRGCIHGGLKHTKKLCRGFELLECCAEPFLVRRVLAFLKKAKSHDVPDKPARDGRSSSTSPGSGAAAGGQERQRSSGRGVRRTAVPAAPSDGPTSARCRSPGSRSLDRSNLAE